MHIHDTNDSYDITFNRDMYIVRYTSKYDETTFPILVKGWSDTKASQDNPHNTIT